MTVGTIHEPSIPHTEIPPESLASNHYDAAVSLWIHLDQARHTTLYNYLMGSTILLLAWATIFAASTRPQRQVVLVALAAAGFVLSAVWAAYGHRANRYVAEAEKTALGFEGTGGPFARRGATRSGLPLPGRLASTTYVIPGVPLLFTLLYAILLAVSIIG